MTNSLLDALAKPPPPPSELDELMSRDPLQLSAQDIDAIIQYQRQARARRESGAKTKKATADSPPSGIDLVSLVTKKPTAPVITKPTSGGFRRI